MLKLIIKYIYIYIYHTLKKANNKDAEQTTCMHRLVCTFVVRRQQSQVFLGAAANILWYKKICKVFRHVYITTLLMFFL